MGIEYSAKLVVGLPYSEMEDFFSDEEDVAGFCYAKGLDYVSPYYDADVSQWIIGVSVARTDDFSWEVIECVHAKYEKAYDEFKEITGLDGELFLSPHGS